METVQIGQFRLRAHSCPAGPLGRHLTGLSGGGGIFSADVRSRARHYHSPERDHVPPEAFPPAEVTIWRSEMTGTGSTDILLAVLGMSPAVLTETVWALAHESPPVIPHQVVVLATRPAREPLVKVLFQERGWARLHEALSRESLPVSGRLCFGPASEHVRLFPKPDGSGDLEDLTSAADHEAAADFIMRALRSFTEDPGTRVIASIAGGRKTMSALLTACMILLGRKQDRLCHVLVGWPYESPELAPLFLFPEPGITHRLGSSGAIYPSEAARIELGEIPYVRIRAWFEREYRHAPASYMSLVRHVQGLTPGSISYPLLKLDYETGVATADGRPVALSAAEFALLWVTADCHRRNRRWNRWADIGEGLENLQKSVTSRQVPDWLWEFKERKNFEAKSDPRKIAFSLRRKLEAATEEQAWIEVLLPHLRRPQTNTYPADRIKLLR